MNILVNSSNVYFRVSSNDIAQFPQDRVRRTWTFSRRAKYNKDFMGENGRGVNWIALAMSRFSGNPIRCLSAVQVMSGFSVRSLTVCPDSVRFFLKVCPARQGREKAVRTWGETDFNSHTSKKFTPHNSSWFCRTTSPIDGQNTRSSRFFVYFVCFLIDCRENLRPWLVYRFNPR